MTVAQLSENPLTALKTETADSFQIAYMRLFMTHVNEF